MKMVEIAEEIIDERGVPMAPKSRRPRRKYDWKQILTVLLCKGVWSFSDLERELWDTGYCSVDGVHRVILSYTMFTAKSRKNGWINS